jgi:hypothetical protein
MRFRLGMSLNDVSNGHVRRRDHASHTSDL